MGPGSGLGLGFQGVCGLEGAQHGPLRVVSTGGDGSELHHNLELVEIDDT